MGISSQPDISPEGQLDALLRFELRRATSGYRLPPQATQLYQQFHPPQFGERESGRYRQFGENECGASNDRLPWEFDSSDGRYQD